MRPLIITSGGAPAKVIRTYRDEIQRTSNCMLLDTSLTDVKELGPIEENNPGYFIMTEGLDDKIYSEYTGIAIGFSIVSGDGNGEAAEGRKGINRQKEDFILAFAMDDELGISEKIWSTIERKKLSRDTDYLLFIAGLGGGTGSGSINNIANRYYRMKEATEAGTRKAFLGSKHIVLGILPSIKEQDQGEKVDRLWFNTVWALYDMLRPVIRPNPMILLDNEAMDKSNPRPTEPIMNIISMLSDWRPNKDGGDFFTKFGNRSMAPYYGCIEKPSIHEIKKGDIDQALLNLVVGEKEINNFSQSFGKWYLTVNQNDLDNCHNNRIDLNCLNNLNRTPDINPSSDCGSLYIITKGLSNNMRTYLKEQVTNLLCIDKRNLESVVMEWPMLDRPEKAEFLLLSMFQSPMQINRIKDMIVYVQDLVNRKDFLENAFHHINRDDTRKVLNDFVREMLKSMDPVTTKDPRFMPKHEIKFLGDHFELVPYEEQDQTSQADHVPTASAPVVSSTVSTLV